MKQNKYCQMMMIMMKKTNNKQIFITLEALIIRNNLNLF